MDFVGQIALDHRYRFGYSFKNPRIVKRATEARSEPWFKMKWAVYGPTQVKSALWRSGKLSKYPSVWKRASKKWRRIAKGRHVRRLHFVSGVEVPDFNELGQAPGPTDKVSTVQRGFWGSLENILNKASDIILAREQSKLARAQAEMAVRLEPIKQESTNVFGIVPWLVGLGVLGVGAYMVFRR